MFSLATVDGRLFLQKLMLHPPKRSQSPRLEDFSALKNSLIKSAPQKHHTSTIERLATSKGASAHPMKQQVNQKHNKTNNFKKQLLYICFMFVSRLFVFRCCSGDLLQRGLASG